MPKIMLDAGHGQSDPGAVGPTKLKEKEAALALTKRVGQLLSQQGVEVSYTRTDDQRLVDSSSAKDTSTCFMPEDSSWNTPSVSPCPSIL